MSDSLEYYHNKGEQDAEDENYDPPHALIDEFTDPRTEKLVEENEAYDQGYYHARGQIDYGNGDYDPPSGDSAREAYDEGWNAAKNS